MDLQKFGVNIYLMQVIFGAVDFPAKLVALLMLSFLGRRLTQGMCLLVSASVIFANIFVPNGKAITVSLYYEGIDAISLKNDYIGNDWEQLVGMFGTATKQFLKKI